MQVHKTRHPANHSVPMYKGTITRRGGLQETDKGNAAPTVHSRFTLTKEPREQPSWWVDSCYVVHPDMKNNSGIYMTLGKD